MAEVECTTCNRDLDACIADPNAPCGAPAQQRAYEETKRLEALVETWKRKEADAYCKGVDDMHAHVREHIRNLCTWSTSQAEMQQNLLRWLDIGAPGGPERVSAKAIRGGNDGA